MSHSSDPDHAHVFAFPHRYSPQLPFLPVSSYFPMLSACAHTPFCSSTPAPASLCSHHAFTPSWPLLLYPHPSYSCLLTPVLHVFPLSTSLTPTFQSGNFLLLLHIACARVSRPRAQKRISCSLFWCLLPWRPTVARRSDCRKPLLTRGSPVLSLASTQEL